MSNGTGPYTLALESLVPPSPTARQTTYGKNLSDDINPADDLDEFFFTGKVGNDVHITAASGSTYPCIELVGPDKKTAGAACGSYATRNEVDKVLTIAGTYTVLVYDFLSNGAGAYTLDLECLSVPCPPALIPAVSGYAKLRGSPLVNCKVCLFQTGAVTQCVRTDNKGYYQFNKIVVGEIYNVTIYGPVVPAAFGTPPSADTADEGLLE